MLPRIKRIGSALGIPLLGPNRLWWSSCVSSRTRYSTLTKFPSRLIRGATGEWEVVVGIEIHAQLRSNSKLFSDAPNKAEEPPNTQVAAADIAFPGSLPVLNEKCVTQVIKAGLALGSTLQKVSHFDRKHYFYADLPLGYQITQHFSPIVTGGSVSIVSRDGVKTNIGISHIQLEQDSGKMIHDQHPSLSLLDLNRAGVGLMEIVSKPDMRSSEEAALYVRSIIRLLRKIDACSANMQLGELRCDVNISVHEPNRPFGTRVEVKNVGSVRFLAKAIDYEAQRQIKLIENNGVVKRETRSFNAAKGITEHLRTKEEETDYRFFPDPDLPPLILTESYIQSIQSAMPEMPEAQQARLIQDYSLSVYEASLLCQEHGAPEYFEALVVAAGNPQRCASWVVNDLYSLLNLEGVTMLPPPVTIANFAELLSLIDNNFVSASKAREALVEMAKNPHNTAKEIVVKLGFAQNNDHSWLQEQCKQLLTENAELVQKYRAGAAQVHKLLMGLLMKKTKGKAPPELANKILKDILDSK